MTDPGDESLAERFAELRRADAAKAPPFGAMWQHKPTPKRVSAWWAAGPAVTAVAAAGAVVVWFGSQRQAERSTAGEPMPAASAVVAPSVAATVSLRVAIEPGPLDFLLDQPALASVPDFDSEPR